MDVRSGETTDKRSSRHRQQWRARSDQIRPDQTRPDQTHFTRLITAPLCAVCSAPLLLLSATRVVRVYAESFRRVRDLHLPQHARRRAERRAVAHARARRQPRNASSGTDFGEQQKQEGTRSRCHRCIADWVFAALCACDLARTVLIVTLLPRRCMFLLLRAGRADSSGPAGSRARSALHAQSKSMSRFAMAISVRLAMPKLSVQGQIVHKPFS